MNATVRFAEQRSLYYSLATLAEGLDRDTPLTLALVFANVARYGKAGVYQSAVQKELGLTADRISRAVINLSTATKNGKPGLGLIDRVVSGDGSLDNRNHILRLTEKGRALADEAVCHLSNPDSDPARSSDMR